MDTPANHGLLNSWKEIATFLGRGVRTVQRWEATLELPVHRVGSGPRSPVIAFTEEVEAWLSARIGNGFVPEASVPAVHPAVMKHLTVVRQLRLSLNQLRDTVSLVQARRRDSRSAWNTYNDPNALTSALPVATPRAKPFAP